MKGQNTRDAGKPRLYRDDLRLGCIHNFISVVDDGRASVGKSAVICGGGLTGLECAIFLADEGKKVTVVGDCSLARGYLRHATTSGFNAAMDL